MIKIVKSIFLIPSLPLVLLLSIIVIINSDFVKLNMSVYSGEISKEIEELKQKIYFRPLRYAVSTIVWILIIKHFI